MMAKIQKKIMLEGDYVVIVSGYFCLKQHLLIDHWGYLNRSVIHYRPQLGF